MDRDCRCRAARANQNCAPFFYGAVVLALVVGIGVSGASGAVVCTQSATTISTAITFHQEYAGCAAVSYNGVTFSGAVTLDIGTWALLRDSTIKVTFASCTFSSTVRIQGVSTTAGIAGMIPFALTATSVTTSSSFLVTGVLPKRSSILITGSTISNTISFQATMFSSAFGVYDSAITTSSAPFRVDQASMQSSKFVIKNNNIRINGGCIVLEAFQSSVTGTSTVAMTDNSFTSSLSPSITCSSSQAFPSAASAWAATGGATTLFRSGSSPLNGITMSGVTISETSFSETAATCCSANDVARTQTNELTHSKTHTLSRSGTTSATSSASQSLTPTPTGSDSASSELGSSSASVTDSGSLTPSETATPTRSATRSISLSQSSSDDTPSDVASLSRSTSSTRGTPTVSASPTATASLTESPSPTPSTTQAGSMTGSLSLSPSQSDSLTGEVTLSDSESATVSGSISLSASLSPSTSSSRIASVTSTDSASQTTSRTVSFSLSESSTLTGTLSMSQDATQSDSASGSDSLSTTITVTTSATTSSSMATGSSYSASMSSSDGDPGTKDEPLFITGVVVGGAAAAVVVVGVAVFAGIKLSALSTASAGAAAAAAGGTAATSTATVGASAAGANAGTSVAVAHEPLSHGLNHYAHNVMPPTSRPPPAMVELDWIASPQPSTVPHEPWWARGGPPPRPM